MNIRESHFQAGPERLFAKTIGEPASHDRPLVFLHGGVGCTAMWRSFPEMLCARAGLPGLVYDRLGYGESGPINENQETEGASFRNRDASEALPKVLDAFNIKTAILIGHSEGGAIALLAAAAHPERIKAVIGIAPQIVVHKRAVEGTLQINEDYQKGVLRQGLIKYHGEKFDHTFARWVHGWTGPEGLEWNTREELAAITCPVLALTGEEDEHGFAENMAELKLCVTAPLGTHLLPGAQHHPQDETPDLVAEHVLRFLDGL